MSFDVSIILVQYFAGVGKEREGGRGNAGKQGDERLVLGDEWFCVARKKRNPRDAGSF